MIPKSHHNIIPAEDRDFFLLLRAGLWQRVEEPLSEAPDWAYIYRLATEQTVQGIVADGIGIAIANGLLNLGTPDSNSLDSSIPNSLDPNLPNSLIPYLPNSLIPYLPNSLYDSFLDQSALIIKQNYKVNQMQAKVCQLLSGEFEKPVVGDLPNSPSPSFPNSPSPSFPNSLIPSIPNSLYDSFLDQSALIIKQNYKVNQMQTSVCRMLDDNAIPYFVVKGQEAARNYPHPMLRCSGDIDLFVLPADYQRAQAVLAQAAGSADHENKVLVDTSFFFNTGSAGDQIEVELHATLHPNLGKRIDRVLDRLQEELFQTSQTPQTTSFSTYCTVYYFLHCLQHFHWSGLGIRQITDWCMLLATKHDSINRNRVHQAIIDMGVQTEWNHFLAFAHEYLGMPKEVYDTWNLTPEPHKLPNSLSPSFPRSLIPLIPNSLDSSFPSSLIPFFPSSQIWKHAKFDGNMGHNREQKARIQNPLLRLVADWTENCRQYFAYRTVSPHVSAVLLGVKAKIYWHALIKK